MSSAVLTNICSENVLQTIINGYVEEFIFSKIPCFQHILMNTFRWMRLNHENCSLGRILFWTLKKYSDYKPHCVNFDENKLKMKAVSEI